ncbi:hypothetical protein SAMN04487764_1757 [Gillisia sp. Hel1_33_143]|uniref:glycosyltransferase family 2 protein n=1 Tax=Gillisia sp. Hel1_33_143 TaxID=1336796 RepID=UPI00087D41E9|nr:glycosyltransferase [Gillisia sp. Hel1_33_143]SDS23595.1 hypothetical protein SAMN04487764_1757 [Gillisia sp. Hel1_33_143]
MNLAIVIPYFKIDFFAATLNSLSEQSNKNFEVYIGNDGSPSNPEEIISQYSNSLPIRYFDFKINLGASSLVSHWQRCIEKVNDAEWILLLGDDDVLEPNCISDFYNNINTINEKNINVVRFGTKIINNRGESISKVHVHEKVENSVNFIMNKILGPARSSLSEHIFRKKFLKFKHFPLAWYSDDLALLEVSNFGDIYSINSSVVSIRASSLNISSNKGLSRIKNIATFEFYHYLINKYYTQFNAAQKLILFDKYEKSVLNDKKNYLLFLKLSKTYIQKNKFNVYFRFFKLYLSNILNAYRSQSREV